MFFYLGISSYSFSQYAEKTFNNEGISFVQIDGKWYELDADGKKKFRVNRNVITVKFKNNASNKLIDSIISKFNVEIIRENPIGYIDLKLSTPDSVINTLKAFKNSDICNYAQLDGFMESHRYSDDSLYNEQWYLETIYMPYAWNYETGSSDIVMCIIDTGIDWLHEDLGKGDDNYQNIWTNPGEDEWTNPSLPSTGNGIDDDNNGYIDDWKGWDFDFGDNDSRSNDPHGTSVAGIASAKTDNNGVGISGLAGGFSGEGVQLMPLCVGDYDSISTSTIDDAIYYATDNGADIINISLGGGYKSYIDSALLYAYNNDVLIVAATGNDNRNYVEFPARHEKVLAVGATDTNDQRWVANTVNGSNYGSQLDVSAPGSNMYTTRPNDRYLNVGSGTSLSAPIASGLAGLLLSYDNALSLLNLNKLITLTADKVGGYSYTNGRCDTIGYGRINAECAFYHLDNPLQLSSTLSGNYKRFFIDIENAAIENSDNVTITGSDITIDGTFEVEIGGVFEIKNSNDFSCQ